jgi:hypothetical protein
LDVIYSFYLDVHYRLCITCIIHQQLWGYRVEDKLHLGVREQKRFNTTLLDNWLIVDGDVVRFTLRPAALYTQEETWYSFVSMAVSTAGHDVLTWSLQKHFIVGGVPAPLLVRVGGGYTIHDTSPTVSIAHKLS